MKAPWQAYAIGVPLTLAAVFAWRYRRYLRYWMRRVDWRRVFEPFWSARELPDREQRTDEY